MTRYDAIEDFCPVGPSAIFHQPLNDTTTIGMAGQAFDVSDDFVYNGIKAAGKDGEKLIFSLLLSFFYIFTEDGDGHLNDMVSIVIVDTGNN